MATRRASSASSATPQAAFVLHQYDWSESSLIVELFTRMHGRVVVAAKGAKRPTSNFRAVLLPFQRITVLLGRAPADDAGEIHPLRNAEWAGGAVAAGGVALYSGFYMNELLLKLLPRQDPHAALFDAYAETLQALQARDETANQAALRAFELRLLRELGWLPELHCVTTTQQPLQAHSLYTLRAEAGLVSGAADQAVPGATWLLIEEALNSGSAAALRQAVAADAATLRTLLREQLHYHLGPAPLRTRRVRLGVQRLVRSAQESPA